MERWTDKKWVANGNIHRSISSVEWSMDTCTFYQISDLIEAIQLSFHTKKQQYYIVRLDPVNDESRVYHYINLGVYNPDAVMVDVCYVCEQGFNTSQPWIQCVCGHWCHSGCVDAGRLKSDIIRTMWLMKHREVTCQ